MDAMLKSLFADGDDDAQRRTKAQDFIKRYDDGQPHEHITDDEVRTLYQVVADRLSPDELEDLAAESYARLGSDERRQLAQVLQEQGGGTTGNAHSDDPRALARMTSQLQAGNPNDLAALLDGGVLEGGDSGAVGSQVRGQGGGVGELLQNPIVRAALGGIAAAAMRRMLR